MSLQMLVPGLAALQGRTRGAGVRVAVLDGPVDVAHPCFDGTRLTPVSTLVDEPAGGGRMSRHGTAVASILLGQLSSPMPGIAPEATGLLVPVFQDYREGQLPQLDLARAVEQAVLAGAHVINISGGERSPAGQADPLLTKALELCAENGVLVVAAAGNDGCDCVHVPAALPPTLAVGALGRDGRPLPSSNWGAPYRENGLLAPGQGLPGAAPGGGLAAVTGTSFATPVVAGVAALLMSMQLQEEGRIDAGAVRRALLGSATGCVPGEGFECDRYLAGVLDIPRAHASVLQEGTRTVLDANGPDTSSTAPQTGEIPVAVPAAATVTPQGSVVPPGWIAMPPGAVLGGVLPATLPATPDGTLHQGTPPQVAFPYGGGYLVGSPTPAGLVPAGLSLAAAAPVSAGVQPAVAQPVVVPAETAVVPTPPARPTITPSEGCGCGGAPGEACTCGRPTGGFVYALGTVGFDFGTETRRDTFRQLMPNVIHHGAGPGGVDVYAEANPFDVFQLTDYLDANRHESTKLIWTLNLDLTPIYAIEAEPYYPEFVYDLLRQALRNQSLPIDNGDYVARMSIPGVLTGRTVQLFSGQVVPVVVAQRRGMYIWNEPKLVDAVITALKTGPDAPEFDEATVRMTLRSFLDKVYFECRNLGQSPADRALNFAVTNAYQFGSGIANGLLTGRLNVAGAEEDIYTLDRIEVIKSPYCRIDSDCWDVRVTWFSPVNDRQAKSVYQFTIDVNDVLPASLAPAHQFLTT